MFIYFCLFEVIELFCNYIFLYLIVLEVGFFFFFWVVVLLQYEYDYVNDFFFNRLVIEILKDVVFERKCFRMVGGVLVERIVKDVFLVLVNNKE